MNRQQPRKNTESWISWTIGLALVVGLRYIMHADDFERDAPPASGVTTTFSIEEIIAAREELLRRRPEPMPLENDSEVDASRARPSDVSRQRTPNGG